MSDSFIHAEDTELVEIHNKMALNRVVIGYKFAPVVNNNILQLKFICSFAQTNSSQTIVSIHQLVYFLNVYQVLAKYSQLGAFDTNLSFPIITLPVNPSAGILGFSIKKYPFSLWLKPLCLCCLP